MSNPQAVITDSDRTVPVSRDLAYEIAAVAAAVLDAREEKTRVAKKFNTDIKALEKRLKDLIVEIRTSGDTQLAIKFGSTVSTARAMAASAPTGDDVDEDLENPEDDDALADEDDDQDDPQNFEDEEATH